MLVFQPAACKQILDEEFLHLKMVSSNFRLPKGRLITNQKKFSVTLHAITDCTSVMLMFGKLQPGKY
jgi:hypothetical protein